MASPAKAKGGGPPSSERLHAKVIDVCGAVGDFIETWGFRSIHGRTWTLLALSTRPLSQAEVAERLGVSRSLVHLAVSELADYGLVRPVNGQRNAPYEARMDVWPTITGVLRKREWMLMESARVALEALHQELGYEARAGRKTPYDLRRVEILIMMTEVAQAALRSLLALRIPESVEGFASWLARARQVARGFERRLPRLLGTDPEAPPEDEI
jgi:DNA-binding transcriptional regulator GbsR (MarR family)